MNSKHIGLTKIIEGILYWHNYRVNLELPVHLEENDYRVDICAKKGKRTIIIEIGYCDASKFNQLKKMVGENNIFHIPYRPRQLRNNAMKEFEKSLMPPNKSSRQIALM